MYFIRHSVRDNENTEHTQVLLPVFAQLDLPSSVGECVGKEEEGEDAVLLFDLLGKCLAQRCVINCAVLRGMCGNDHMNRILTFIYT